MAMSRPWSECAATPPATCRAKWRAAMVGMSAPQMPVFSSASLPTSRHGPMLQIRQQAPLSPIGHGFMASARLNAVSIPHSSAWASMSSAAGSMLWAATGLAVRLLTSSMKRLLRPARRAARAGGGRRARMLVAGTGRGKVDGQGWGARSVLAVVPRHGEVGRVGGGDTDSCGRPGGLVGRRRLGLRAVTGRIAGLLEQGGDALRVGFRRVVVEAQRRVQGTGAHDDDAGFLLDETADGDHVVVGPHARDDQDQLLHSCLLAPSPREGVGMAARGRYATPRRNLGGYPL